MPTPDERTDDFSYKPIDNQNLTTQVVYNPNRKPTADELLSKLYSKNIPEPVFDQDKADRLQRMGRLNQVGRSLNVLGDIFGTAIGANTHRRQPDTTAPALYQSYQANLDKYKAEKDANLLRDYDKERQDILHQISRADRQEGIDIAQKRFDAQQRMQAAKNNLELQQYLAGLTQKEREAAERARHNKATEGLAGERNNIQKNKEDKSKEKPFNPIQVRDNQGQLDKIEEGDWTKLYNESQGDSKLAKEFQAGNMKVIKAQFESQPDVYQKELARAYYEFINKPENRERAALEKARSERGLTNSAQDDINKPRTSIQQPVQQPKAKNNTSIYTF